MKSQKTGDMIPVCTLKYNRKKSVDAQNSANNKTRDLGKYNPRKDNA